MSAEPTAVGPQTSVSTSVVQPTVRTSTNVPRNSQRYLAYAGGEPGKSSIPGPDASPTLADKTSTGNSGWHETRDEAVGGSAPSSGAVRRCNHHEGAGEGIPRGSR